MTPGFGTLVMGASALLFYLVLSFASANALQDSVASLGLAVAFYYGITAYACVWYFRRTLLDSARNLFMRGIFPLLGALCMTWAFVQSAVDMLRPDYGFTAFGPFGGRVRSRRRNAGGRNPPDVAVFRDRLPGLLPRTHPHRRHGSEGARVVSADVTGKRR